MSVISKREAIYRRDGRRCVYCLRAESDLKPDNPLTLDHLVPIAEGGKGDPANLVTACQACNRRKGNMSLSWFVGPTRAAVIRAQAQQPIDYSGKLVPTNGLPPPKAPPPAYPTSMNNKLHDLVRDLVNTLAYVQPVPAAKMKERARGLGVKFPGEYAALQEAVDAGRLGEPPPDSSAGPDTQRPPPR